MNLSMLKKALKKGSKFVIVTNYQKPDWVGERIVNVVQTNGIYSYNPNDESFHTMNGGKGSWLSFGKAADWKFEDGLCKQFATVKHGTETVTIPLLDLRVE